jgi:hypothetical protein
MVRGGLELDSIVIRGPGCMVLQEGSAMTGSGDRLSSPFSPVLPERVFPEDAQQDLCKMSTRWSSTLHRGRVPAPRVSLPRTTSRSRASILYCCPSPGFTSTSLATQARLDEAAWHAPCHGILRSARCKAWETRPIDVIALKGDRVPSEMKMCVKHLVSPPDGVPFP